MDKATDCDGSSTSRRSRCPGHTLRLREAASHLGARGGSESKRVEGNSLAARHQGMVGVALRGHAGTAIAWIRSWGTATPKNMVASGMAEVGERTHQILLLRLARNLYPSSLGALGEVSLEDRACARFLILNVVVLVLRPSNTQLPERPRDQWTSPAGFRDHSRLPRNSL